MSDTKFNKLIKFPENKQNSDVFLDKKYLENISALNSYSFSNNNTLSSIFIPEYISEIGENAFINSDNVNLFIDSNKYSSPLLSQEITWGLDTNKIHYLQPSEFYYTFTYPYDKVGPNILNSEKTQSITFKYTFNKTFDGIIITGILNSPDDSSLSVDDFCLHFPYTIHNLPVVEIGPYAFSNYKINHIEFNTNLKIIGNNSFIHSTIGNPSKNTNYITIPPSVTDIGRQAFAGINNLSSIYFYGLSSNIKLVDTLDANAYRINCEISSIGEGAFRACSHLQRIIFADTHNNDWDMQPSGPDYGNDHFIFVYHDYDNNFANTNTKKFSYLLARHTDESGNPYVTLKSAPAFNITMYGNTNNYHYIALPMTYFINFGYFGGFDKWSLAGLETNKTLILNNNAANLDFSKIKKLDGSAFYVSRLLDIRFSDTNYTYSNYFLQRNILPSNTQGNYRCTIYFPSGNGEKEDGTVNTDALGDLIWLPPYGPVNEDIIRCYVAPDIYSTSGAINEFFINSNNISAFGEYAFSGNHKIKEINFTATDSSAYDSIKEIKEGAIQHCHLLTSFTSEKLRNLSSVGVAAFYACYEMTSCFLNSTNLSSISGGNIFGLCSKLDTIVFSENLSSFNPNFYDSLDALSNLRNIQFGPSTSLSSENEFFKVETLSVDSFLPRNSKYLKKKTSDDTEYLYSLLPKTITDNNLSLIFEDSKNYFVGKYFINGFSKINTISATSNLSVDQNAFINISTLKNVYIDDNSNISLNSFSGSNNIENLTIGKDIKFSNNIDTPDFSEVLTSLYDSFDETTFKNIKNLDLSTNNTILYIPTYMCYNNTSLATLSLPSSIKGIEEKAFYSCTDLTSNITIPSSLYNIKADAFNNCTKIPSITFENSIIPSFIETSAFYNCTSLTSITLPDGLVSIGDSAFKNCTSLTSITIPKNVTSLGNEFLSGCSSLLSIYIDQTSSDSLLYDQIINLSSILSNNVIFTWKENDEDNNDNTNLV